MTVRKNPFRGPRPFNIGDQATFYGRVIDRELLLKQVLSSRIVVVHAPTGSGKSSLINATLIPSMEQRGYLTPKVEAFRPSQLWALDRASQDAQLDAPISKSDVRGGLAASLGHSESILEEDGPDALILVDQLEEIFTSRRNTHLNQAAFFACLGELSHQEHLWIVLVVREDFLAKTLAHSYRFEGRLRSRFAVPLLSIEATRKIIQATLGEADQLTATQLERLSGRIARASQDGLGDDLSSLEKLEIIEPLILQLLCHSWVDEAGDTPLKEVPIRDDLADLSLVKYVDGSLAEAAGDAAEATPSAAADGEDGAKDLEDLLREWCEDQLVEGEARKQAFLPEPADARRKGLSRLLDSGFLAHRSGGRVELTHDRFVGALIESNTRWYRSREGFVVGQRRQWTRGGRLDSDLLPMHQVLLNWRHMSPETGADVEFAAASKRAFINKASLLLATLAVFVMAISLTAWLTIRPARIGEQKAIEGEEAAWIAAVKARKLEGAAKKREEAAELKGRSVNLSLQASVLGDSGSVDDVALAMALRGFELARDQAVDRGSVTKAHSRSVLLQRVTDPVFLRRRVVEVSQDEGFSLKFDAQGVLWECGTGKEGSAANRSIGDPFARGVVASLAESGGCDTEQPREEWIEADTVRVVTHERHTGDGIPSYTFVHIETAGNEGEGRSISLQPHSKSRLEALAGVRLPTLQKERETPIRTLRRVRLAQDGVDDLVGVSVTRRGAGYLWRVATKDALSCLAGEDCRVNRLVGALWLTRSAPVDVWISPEGHLIRAVSEIGEVTQVELAPVNQALRPVGKSKRPISSLLLAGDALLASNPFNYFSYSRENPGGQLNRRDGDFPSCSEDGGFFPSFLGDTGNGAGILAIGRDGCPVNATVTADGLVFGKGKKLWTDGKWTGADLIVDLRNEFGDSERASGKPSLLAVRGWEQPQNLSFFDIVDGKPKRNKAMEMEQDELRMHLGWPTGYKITSVAALGSMIAFGGSARDGLEGRITLCRLQLLAEHGCFSSCRTSEISNIGTTGFEEDSGEGPNSLAFSATFEARPERSSVPTPHAYLAAATVGGAVELYSLKMDEQLQWDGEPLRHVASLRSHIREAVGVDWADRRTDDDSSPDQARTPTHLLASIGKDGVVSIIEVPEAFVRDDVSGSVFERFLVPVAVHRHLYPLTAVRFDGERLYVGGEDGWLQYFDLQADVLVERACALLFGHSREARVGLETDGKFSICREGRV